jgi:hypothetical protein
LSITFFSRSWLRQGLLVALAILTVAYVIMLIANISPPPNSGMQCPWQFPKIFSCVLGTNLAGGVLGAGGALFAAWMAWMAVQRQIEEQQRQARVVERAYISGGGGQLVKDHPNLFVLTAQNYGKTPGTVTAYALSVCDRADLPLEPDYLKPGYTPTPFIATYPPGGGTLGITTTAIPQSAANPIAYGRLWYRDIWGDEYHFSFIISILTPHDHTDLVSINKAYTSST